MDFEDKIAIVTGGAKGIGLCIAQTFLELGARVVIADWQDISEKAIKLLEKYSGKYSLFVADISDEDSVDMLCQKATEFNGKIDFLINNAAISHNKPITEITYCQWKRVLDVNLSGSFLCAKKCVPFMPAGSAIVNIASTRAAMSEANTEAYSASKAGIIGLTHALALSLSHKVRVNCISPGWIDTTEYCPCSTELSPNTQADHLQHPAGRVGLPQDIADMAAYLCSEKAGFITGQNFIIDGGMTKKMVYV